MGEPTSATENTAQPARRPKRSIRAARATCATGFGATPTPPPPPWSTLRPRPRAAGAGARRGLAARVGKELDAGGPLGDVGAAALRNGQDIREPGTALLRANAALKERRAARRISEFPEFPEGAKSHLCPQIVRRAALVALRRALGHNKRGLEMGEATKIRV